MRWVLKSTRGRVPRKEPSLALESPAAEPPSNGRGDAEEVY
jgi:hypothetical protein